jgi:hypothetical protein
MSLVAHKPGTELSRPLVWESTFGGAMLVAPHHRGKRLEFFVTNRGGVWELACSYNDGCGSKPFHIADNPKECQDYAQAMVDNGR